jgi:hypothetical protein
MSPRYPLGTKRSQSSSRHEGCILMALHEWTRRIGPYASLAIVLVPLMIVEPLKLVGVFFAGEGHWVAGILVLILAYAGSLLVVERLFRLLKPNILRAPALAKCWAWFVSARRGIWRFLKQLTA